MDDSRGKMHQITPETKMKQQDAHIEHLNEELNALKANYNFLHEQYTALQEEFKHLTSTLNNVSVPAGEEKHD